MAPAFMAILHLAFDTPAGRARKAAIEAGGHGLYHIHPLQNAVSAVREFPPDVAIVEVAERPTEALKAAREILAVPRRRGDSLPMVLAEVRPEDEEAAREAAPHAVLLPPGKNPDEVLQTAWDTITKERAAWGA